MPRPSLGRRKVLLSLPPSLVQELDELARAEGLDRGVMAQRLLGDALARELRSSKRQAEVRQANDVPRESSKGDATPTPVNLARNLGVPWAISYPVPSIEKS